MNKRTLQKYSESLVEVITEMNTSADVYNFLLDLLTPGEIEEFSRRFEVATMLEGGIKYSDIEKKTGVSSTTVARISKFLKGDNKGYKNAIAILKSVTDKHHTGHQSKKWSF